MNTGLKIIQRRIKAVENAQDDVTSAMERVFPFGKEISFKRSNMKLAAPAAVQWARMLNGYAELRVRNLQTGKNVKISINDVVEI